MSEQDTQLPPKDTQPDPLAIFSPDGRKTAEYVRERLEGQAAGHGFDHAYRVATLALNIARQEGVDLRVVEQASLLHDIADYKFHGGDETVGPRMAREWVTGIGFDEEKAAQVAEIIATLSFKGAGVAEQTATREGMVVQDADRLEALGAIGIARAFAMGEKFGEPMWDPTIEPQMHQTAEEYMDRHANTNTTINHFYEKLQHLPDRMFTETGKRMAHERWEYMDGFLTRFKAEWTGQS